MQEEEDDRKEREEMRTKHWKLMRLKQNEPKWRTRRIEECARIKEMEKEDRLSIVKIWTEEVE